MLSQWLKLSRPYVITTGNRPGLIGHAYADAYYPADFSDKSAVLSLAKKLRIDAICACANDFGATTAAYVAEAMGLPGHDSYKTTLTLHHKHLFKAFAQASGISTPDARWCSSKAAAYSILENMSLPLIVKPVDLTGGKGITKVACAGDYRPAIDKAFTLSRAKTVVIEDFIRGSAHSFSAFVLNGKIVFYYSDNEYTYKNPFLITTSAGPATGIHEVVAQLIREAEHIVSLLALRDGILHIQYIHSEGKAWIIEVTRRCPGDFYPYPVSSAGGLDWAEWIVAAEAGADCFRFPRVRQNGFHGRHCIMSPRNGIVRAVEIDRSLQNNIYDSFMMWSQGDVIEQYMTHKLGVLFLRYDSEEEMLEKSHNMTRLVRVELAY